MWDKLLIHSQTSTIHKNVLIPHYIYLISSYLIPSYFILSSHFRSTSLSRRADSEDGDVSFYSHVTPAVQLQSSRRHPAIERTLRINPLPGHILYPSHANNDDVMTECRIPHYGTLCEKTTDHSEFPSKRDSNAEFGRFLCW